MLERQIQFEKSYSTKKRIQHELRKWINKHEYTHAITITFKNYVWRQNGYQRTLVFRNDAEIQKAIQILIDRINQQIFSGSQRRKGEKCKVAVFLEGNMKCLDETNLHAHIAIKLPKGKYLKTKRYQNEEQFKLLIIRIITKIDFINLEFEAKNTFKSNGWVNYISKKSSHRLNSLDDFDVFNSNI